MAPIKTLSIAAIAALVYAGNASAGELNCNSSSVRLKGHQINVTPTGGNDTIPLQCAMDEAQRLGIQTVILEAGTFKVSSLSVSDFDGVIQGRSMDKTTLKAIDGEMVCNATVEDDEASAAVMRFVRGAPRVENLTISASFPCNPGEIQDFQALAFTTSPKQCGKTERHAEVDKVRFVGNNKNSANRTAVNNTKTRTCPRINGNSPRGSFKVTNSEFTGWTKGVSTRAVGGALVDINFNTFKETRYGINVYDANQLLNISKNKFWVSDAAKGNVSPRAIYVGQNRENGPNFNRVVIYSNKFNFERPDLDGLMIFINNSEVDGKVSVSIDSNRFQTGSRMEKSPAVSIADIDNGSIAGNIFSGGNDTAVYIYASNFPGAAKGWSIAGNNFSKSDPVNSDIFFGSNTSGNVVGPDQFAISYDASKSNHIIASPNAVRMMVSAAITDDSKASAERLYRTSEELRQLEEKMKSVAERLAEEAIMMGDER